MVSQFCLDILRALNRIILFFHTSVHMLLQYAKNEKPIFMHRHVFSISSRDEKPHICYNRIDKKRSIAWNDIQFQLLLSTVYFVNRYFGNIHNIIMILSIRKSFLDHNALMNFKAIIFNSILSNARKCKSNEASNVSVNP